MKHWTWTGDEWRQVSPNEAAYRRVSGFVVVDGKDAPKEPPAAKKPKADAGG
jgi:hypothetical protein